MIATHGAIENGGVAHGLSLLSEEDLATAIAAYTYFGLPEAGRLLVEARRLIAELDPGDEELDEDQEEALVEAEEALEAQLDGEYHSLVPADDTLVVRFEAVLRERPQDFS